MRNMYQENKTANIELIVAARESRGITQKELSDMISMTQGGWSKIEKGIRELPVQTLQEVANVLNYPIELFFLNSRIYGVGTTELFNRKRQSVPCKILQKIHAQINMKRIQISRMVDGVEMPDDNIPNFDINDFKGSIEDIAAAVRTQWRLPRGPINNLIEILEDKGGVVIPFAFNTEKIDAMSVKFPDAPPLFFINPIAPRSRLRFTLCHELAHIVMHQFSLNPEIEEQADRFASEFLLPSKEIRPYLDNLSLSKLMDLKRYWKVSMQAMLMKAKELDMINPSRSKSLWMQMSKYGYRKNEPLEDEIPEEKPTLLNEIIETYKEEMGYSLKEFSKVVCLNELEAKQTYYGMGNSRLRLVK